MRGWNFFAILASSISPSADLYYSILNWLMNEIKNNLDTNIVKRANYIFARLSRVFEMRRKHIPTEEEIIHIESMKPIMFPIYFFSNTNTLVPTESYTTVKELKQIIMNKLELLVTKVPYYSLYEVCNKEKVIEERFLEDFDRVVDVIAVWAKETDDFAQKKEKIDFRIYLKLLIFYDFKKEDTDSLTMLYVQSCYDVIMGKFDLEVNDVIELAALQLLINYQTDSEMAYKFLDRNLSEYIPKNLYDKEHPPTWTKKIFEKYRELPEYNKLEAKNKYVEYLKSNPLFEAHQFNATVKFFLIYKYKIQFSKTFNTTNVDSLPSDLIVGIRKDGIIICDKNRKELMSINYAYVASWGVNSNVFVLVVQKTEFELKKIYLESYNVMISINFN